MNTLRWIFAAFLIYIYFQTNSWIALGIGIVFGLGALATSLSWGKSGIATEAIPKQKSPADQIREAAASRKSELAKISTHSPILAVYVGGSFSKIGKGSTVYLSTIDNDFVISHATNNLIESRIDSKKITAIEISGPGTQTTNAGLIGGGFGLEGAVKGMMAAALINAATTKTTTNTFLRVATHDSEALFHFNDQEPSALRLTLSHLFVAADGNKAPKAVATNSISDELAKFQSLKEAGVLSEEEFSKAKQKLLA